MAATLLTITLDTSTLERFRTIAENACRTPEEQAHWLIRIALDAAEYRNTVHGKQDLNPQKAAAYEERLRAAGPLVTELRLLHRLAGWPSSRALSHLITQNTMCRCSHSTVNGILNRTIVPSWTATQGLATVLGGNLEQFRQLWIESRISAGEQV